jgi:hypothetical protein
MIACMTGEIDQLLFAVFLPVANKVFILLAVDCNGIDKSSGCNQMMDVSEG